MIDSAEGVTRYELAPGRAQSLEHYLIFGAGAYGVILPEKRQQLRLDKADQRVTHGVYIGNVKGTNSW